MEQTKLKKLKVKFMPQRPRGGVEV